MTAPDPSHVRPAESPVLLLALTGFMGAGKTTVGRLLAEQSGWQFQDADSLIEAETGSTIAELFSRHGEPWFRALEHQTIRRLVLAAQQKSNPAATAPTQIPQLLALGGGAMEDAQTRELLLHSPKVKLIHLEVSLPEAIRRCTADSVHQRPVLAERTRLAARYAQRLPLYRQAHTTIPVDALSPDQVVVHILNWLRRNEGSSDASHQHP